MIINLFLVHINGSSPLRFILTCHREVLLPSLSCAHEDTTVDPRAQRHAKEQAESSLVCWESRGSVNTNLLSCLRAT